MVIHIEPHDKSLRDCHCLVTAVTLAGYSTVDFLMELYSHLRITNHIPFKFADKIIRKHCHVSSDSCLVYKKSERISFRELVLEYPAIVLVDNHYVYSPGEDRYLSYVEPCGKVIAIWYLPILDEKF